MTTSAQLCPITNPYSLSIEEKLDLIEKSNGALIGLLKDIEMRRPLRLHDMKSLTYLPDVKWVEDIQITACPNFSRLPRRLATRQLHILGISGLKEMPRQVEWEVDSLELICCTELRNLATGIKASKIDLTGCCSLTELPEEICLSGSLSLDGCERLEHLPKRMKIGRWLDLRGCTSIKELPAGLKIGEWLRASDCWALEHISSCVRVGGRLELDRCRSLQECPVLPHVHGPIKLPEHLEKQVAAQSGSHTTKLPGPRN